MEASDIEQIKKSYIYNIATDVTPKTQPEIVIPDIKNIIKQIEDFIKIKYPQYWKDYNEGKMYADKNLNQIISNLFAFSIKLLKIKLDEQIEPNSNKQVIMKLLNNQIYSIQKLNTIYEDFNVDSTPLILYLIGYLLKTI